MYRTYDLFDWDDGGNDKLEANSWVGAPTSFPGNCCSSSKSSLCHFERDGGVSVLRMKQLIGKMSTKFV